MQMDGNLVMYPIHTADHIADAYWASGTDNAGIKNYMFLNNTGLLLINGSNSKTDVISDLFTLLGIWWEEIG